MLTDFATNLTNIHMQLMLKGRRIGDKFLKVESQRAYFKKSTREKTLGIGTSKSMQMAEFRQPVRCRRWKHHQDVADCTRDSHFSIFVALCSDGQGYIQRRRSEEDQRDTETAVKTVFLLQFNIYNNNNQIKLN